MKHLLTIYFFIVAVSVILVGWYISWKPSLSHVVPKPTRQVIGTSDIKTTKFVTTIRRVIDGDTIETTDGKKIRYIGINTPELGQPYGEDAKNFNTALIAGKKVTVVYDVQQKDAYGRTLGYVYVGSNFVNLEIVKKGWAIAENISPNTLHGEKFAQAEKNAKHDCQGLWSDLCIPVTSSCINITSIHYDAAGNDNTNLNEEWVAIKNSCQNTVDLSEWLLKDSAAQHAYTFSAISLVPGASLRVHSGCGMNSTTDLYWQCDSKSTAVWNNGGDEAMLFDRHGKLLSAYKY